MFSMPIDLTKSYTEILSSHLSQHFGCEVAFVKLAHIS